MQDRVAKYFLQPKGSKPLNFFLRLEERLGAVNGQLLNMFTKE